MSPTPPGAGSGRWRFRTSGVIRPDPPRGRCGGWPTTRRASSGLRASFRGGWEDEDGNRRPYIHGVTFEAIDLEGTFPEAAVVATFRHADRPRIRFGRRFPLYDELGNPVGGDDYWDIELMEDVETGRLPPDAACVADGDGIVWM